MNNEFNNNLHEGFEAYKELSELLPQTVFEMDISGMLTFANKNGFKMFGHSEKDFKTGLNVLQMIIPEHRAAATERMKQVMSGIKSNGNEYTALRKDGTTFPV